MYQLFTLFNELFSLFQFLIFVIDSTDRERLHISKSELYNMLSQEVGQL